MRKVRYFRVLGRVICLLALASTARSFAQEAPAGFTVERIASGLTGATTMCAAHDGRIFVCEQTGALRLVERNGLVDEPVLTVAVDAFWERGLLGVAIDPAFPERPFLYVHYVPGEPFPRHRISRFKLEGNRAVAGSELVLLDGDDQRKLGGSVPAGHQGGAIRFGPDGMLYAGIGEQTAGAPAQSLDTLQGKILRLRPDGSIPEDNPFFAQAAGKYRAIWALGLRNPFALAFDPASGRLFANDVGGAAWEEVDEIVRGGNYGWPVVEGVSLDPRFRDPIHAYGRGEGKSIAGGAFYACRVPLFPETLRGKYFFAEYDGGWIEYLDPAAPERPRMFARGFKGPVDLQVGADGALYVLERNAWVRDEKFQPRTGSLVRIGFDPRARQAAVGSKDAGAGPPELCAPAFAAQTGAWAPPHPSLLPRVLSQTGLFVSMADLTPAPGVVPYEVNSPLWSDGARKRRWIALPRGTRAGFSAEGEWKFPPGTLLVKHFEITLDAAQPEKARRLETRLLYANGDGTGYGATYRWRPDGCEADLLEGSRTDHLSGPDGEASQSLDWFYPGPLDCLACHTVGAGFVLGVNTRQLNRDLPAAGGGVENQLRAWSRLGLVDGDLETVDVAKLPRLHAVGDAAVPLEDRVRSFLDANCSQCHRPGGTRGQFDARFATPLERQGLIDGPLLGGDAGPAGARVVVPGDPARSALLDRMRRGDVFRMPPIAVRVASAEASAAVEEWIRELVAKR